MNKRIDCAHFVRNFPSHLGFQVQRFDVFKFLAPKPFILGQVAARVDLSIKHLLMGCQNPRFESNRTHHELNVCGPHEHTRKP